MRHASPIVYAHRGASLELPENTLEAFGLALDLGANALETDAHMTKDGRVVLSHDPTGARMAGVSTPIRDATLAEIRTWDVAARFVHADGSRVNRAYRVPTFDEALAAYPDAFFNVDAKQLAPDMIPALVRTIRAANATDRVRIASFSTRTLRRARALGFEGPTGLSSLEVARVMMLPLALLERIDLGGDAAQVPERASGFTFASQASIDRFHRLGMRIDFWTIDDPARARALFAMGADGVVTNDPRAVCAARGILSA